MTNPIVSFVIVSWNTREYLKRCLLSIERYANVPREVIVVDNGSVDGSVEMVRLEFPGVILMQKNENLGFAKANNIGLRAARGTYMCLLNSDTEVQSGCVKTLLDIMNSNLEVGMSGPLVLGQSGKAQDLPRAFPNLWNMICFALGLGRLMKNSRLFNGYEIRDHDLRSASPAEVLSGCFWFVRAESVKRIGGLDESFFMYGEDMDWCKRFHDNKLRIIFQPLARVIHYGGASSSRAPIKFFIEMQRANLQYWRKHHGLAGLASYFAILIVHHVIRFMGWGAAFLLKPGDRAVTVFKIKRSLVTLRWLSVALFVGIKRKEKI